MSLFPQDDDSMLKTFVRGCMAGAVVLGFMLAVACMGKYLGS